MNICHVVGARPNFMKAAPVLRALAEHDGVRQRLVHTGQHYDVNMSRVFFEQLEIDEPDINLEVGSESHAVQTAAIMELFEQDALQHQPDLVLVYGDVNSTLAAALVCVKLFIPVAHVEAGLRSFDRRMPEEINRLLTDQMADLLFTPSVDADENLLREGLPAARIHFVGNVMIDTLVRLLPHAIPPAEGLPERYALVTLHRPSNVDEPQTLRAIMQALGDISAEVPVLFPVHPRTRQRLEALGWGDEEHANLGLLPPAGYLEFLFMQRGASVVITDSGGVQEETTYLGVPCLTLRTTTERPVTVSLGTNIVIGQDMHRLRQEARRILAGERKHGTIPPLWDGHAGERIARILMA
jgi:UDP-N-acetylglucosamine 2-epimerase (non-hydrolysing)